LAELLKLPVENMNIVTVRLWPKAAGD